MSARSFFPALSEFVSQAGELMFVRLFCRGGPSLPQARGLLAHVKTSFHISRLPRTHSSLKIKPGHEFTYVL